MNTGKLITTSSGEERSVLSLSAIFKA